MSNEIRTRRLIVTLPGVAAEEIDEIASEAEQFLRDDSRFYPVQRAAMVTHALDAAPLPGLTCFPTSSGGVVVRDAGQREVQRLALNPNEARKLAALLLRAADEAEEQS